MILVGRDDVFTDENGTGTASAAHGFLEAFQYTALQDGDADTLNFRVSATAACTADTVFLAIYSDSADSPDALLASVEVPGTPALGDVVTGSITPVAIVAGTKYWLAMVGVKAAGTSVMNFPVAIVAGGGDRDWSADDEVTAPLDPWPGTSAPNKFDDGPASFWAEGAGGAEEFNSGLVFQVTGLWTEDALAAGAVDFYGTIADPQDGEVRIPRNDSRTAQVTVSLFDPIVQHMIGHSYARCLRVFDNDECVFWHAFKLAEVDMDAGTATFSAVDPSLRLIHHFIRRGDINGDLGADTQDRATVPIDHIGLRTIRDSGINTAGQTARGVPDLGIADGTNDFVAAPDDLMGVARGDQSWEAMLQLSQSLGPDFELEPVIDVPGVYANLNTFVSQGTDKSATVVFHYGTGKDNLDNLAFTEGSKYTTHVQVLDRESTYRVTPANLATSLETGPYVDWEVTEFDARNVPRTEAEAVLRAHGQDILNAYSHPLIVLTLTLPIERDADFRYGRDFGLGDIVGVAGRTGFAELPEAPYRISVVTLKQDGAENATRTELEVVASHVPDTDTEE